MTTPTSTAVHPDRAAWQPGGPASRLTSQTTVGTALADWHRSEPDAVVAYLQEGEEWNRLTVADLWKASVRVAEELAAVGVLPAGTVALSADTSADLLAALFGTMLHGAAPFVVEPPLIDGRNTLWAERFRHMVTVARPQAALTAGRAADVTAKTCVDLGLPVLTAPFPSAETSQRRREAAALPCPVSPDAIAYLQFTSGTTGDAKAVKITHRQLLANVAALGRHVGYRRSDLMVGWLPLHHDMGLVGTVFSSFLHRMPVALMPPLAFAFRPERWLQTVSYFKGTLSAAPNFAYHLCASRTSDKALSDVDLSSWRGAFNGAETVTTGTLRLWQNRMGPRGFAPEAMVPCYGMAEVGLVLTLPHIGQPLRPLHVDRTALARSGHVIPVDPDHPDGEQLTSVGQPLPGYRIRIMDPDGQELPEYRQGRLIISGPSLTDGYFTADGLDGRRPRGGWLDTGDLGFFADGDLFITGRIKELIILAGRNYLPYSLEEAAAEVTGTQRGAVAAIGIHDAGKGTESLVVVAESASARSPEKKAELAANIEHSVAKRTGLRPDRVLVVRRGVLPKTSSGKLQRALITAMVISGQLSHS